MARRSFGWIQDAGDIFKLRTIAEIFVFDSKINKELRLFKLPKLIRDKQLLKRFIEELSSQNIIIPYTDLKGRGPLRGETRSNASCSGIAQAIFKAQNGREYQSDWATESYIRFAVSTGILNYDRDSDTCSLSDFGKKLINTELNSKEEKECLGCALLSYPPVSRILSLLSNSSNPLSKYQLGRNLGFIGEKGFSSFKESLIFSAMAEADKKELKDIKSNSEGTSDKYARMICSWLEKLGWVTSKRVQESFISSSGFTKTFCVQKYEITLLGQQNFNRSLGKSSHSKRPKIVMAEMLATAENDVAVLRKRRAVILKYILNNRKTTNDIKLQLEDYDFVSNEATIIDDIKGLINIGINISSNSEGYRVEDEIIGLEIPEIKKEKDAIISYNDIKDNIRSYLKLVNHKYLSLLDYSVDPKNYVLFEMETIDLIQNELGFKACHLGYSNKPDGLMSVDNHGVIIDNKAYSKGFKLDVGFRREMKDYILENQSRDPKINSTKWWENFPNTDSSFSFLFVSSSFNGKVKENIESLSYETKTNGAVITAENLLKLAEKIKEKSLTNQAFINLLCSNNEIII